MEPQGWVCRPNRRFSAVVGPSAQLMFSKQDRWMGVCVPLGAWTAHGVCVRALEKGPMRRPEGLAVIELIQSQEYSGLTD